MREHACEAERAQRIPFANDATPMVLETPISEFIKRDKHRSRHEVSCRLSPVDVRCGKGRAGLGHHYAARRSALSDLMMDAEPGRARLVESSPAPYPPAPIVRH